MRTGARPPGAIVDLPGGSAGPRSRAPWLCAPGSPRVCSEQEAGRAYPGRDTMLLHGGALVSESNHEVGARRDALTRATGYV